MTMEAIQSCCFWNYQKPWGFIFRTMYARKELSAYYKRM